MRTGTLHKLSAVAIKRAEDGMHSDGGGLFLRVRGEARGWLFRFTSTGRKREMGLGPYPAVSLADARQAAAEARQLVARGEDPIEARQTTARAAEPEAEAQAPRKATTFEQALDRYLRLKSSEWSSPKHAGLWRNSLHIHAKALMPKPVGEITTADVVDVLVPIWADKHDTAKRVRQRIERVLSASIALGERPAPNPAAWPDGLEFVMSKQQREVSHHAAVPVQDAPTAFAKIWARRESGQGTRGLLIAVLSTLRSGEVRRMEWGDVGASEIVIPKDRMKARAAHRTPLTPLLDELLQSVPRYADTPLVLPSSRLTPVSDMTLAKGMKSAGLGAYTVHGWRSTFSDWANAEGWARHLIEDQLAHKVGNDVELAYRRSDYLDARRPMMAAWEGYLRSKLNTR